MVDHLECPCCGEVAARADADGFFWDGDPLLCGCSGCVSCDGESDAYINIWWDEPCAPHAPCQGEV